ncbi:hypothetical protein RND71_027591 [Anisodus tanguticus]|uniref:BRI1 kinase inhibitor 1-like n=1 Tax=Anisodus tanguticus TaxID=243964 RepID=A0AAE1V0Q1_9SOLA|nr:hypothetical protein RND71_027591 [Anisodus tanguticus]
MGNIGVGEELKQSNQENQNSKQIQHQQPPPLQLPSSGGGAAASPPSASSSPSHEFSFTISLHPTNSINTPDNKTKQNPNPNPNQLAIDLTPADEIFFHGHLLPLHLLSHLPVSPRSSTNSIDSSLPIKDLQKIQNSINDDNSYYDLNHSFHHHNHQTNSFNIRKDQKQKSKSFSLFGLPKRKKEEKEDKEKQRKLNVSQVIKRYMRMVRPFLSFRSRKNMQFHRQSYSYSGNLSFRGKNNNSSSNNSSKGIKRGAYSAPVSMKNSPTNSGLLVATPGANYHNSSSSGNSTMEELQAAIQAAIAHCKKSSSMEEKKSKCQENEDIVMK